MLETVELPAGVSNLAASLAHVNRDTFPLNTDLVKINCEKDGERER